MSDEESENKVIKDCYESFIAYYKTASKKNGRWYRWTRLFTIVLGASVTLVAAVAAKENADEIARYASPILAFLLTVVAGISQNFQFGSAWHKMTLTWQELEHSYAKYKITPPERRDHEAELEKIRRLVREESETFFGRIFGNGTGKPEMPDDEKPPKDE